MESRSTSSSDSPGRSPETASQRVQADPTESGTVSQTLADMRRQVSEISDFASFYLAAKVELLKLTVRKGIIFLAIAIVAAVAAAGLIVTAVVLICDGIARALAYLFGSVWLGELVTGVLVIGAIVGSIWLVVNRIFKTSHAKTQDRFDRMRARQRTRFGHDVGEDPAIAASAKKSPATDPK